MRGGWRRHLLIPLLEHSLRQAERSELACAALDDNRRRLRAQRTQPLILLAHIGYEMVIRSSQRTKLDDVLVHAQGAHALLVASDMRADSRRRSSVALLTRLTRLLHVTHELQIAQDVLDDLEPARTKRATAPPRLQPLGRPALLELLHQPLVVERVVDELNPQVAQAAAAHKPLELDGCSRSHLTVAYVLRARRGLLLLRPALCILEVSRLQSARGLCQLRGPLRSEQPFLQCKPRRALFPRLLPRSLDLHARLLLSFQPRGLLLCGLSCCNLHLLPRLILIVPRCRSGLRLQLRRKLRLCLAPSSQTLRLAARLDRCKLIRHALRLVVRLGIRIFEGRVAASIQRGETDHLATGVGWRRPIRLLHSPQPTPRRKLTRARLRRGG